MLVIEQENDLVIDLKSANDALFRIPDIKSLYSEARGTDEWNGILDVKGEDFVIAQITPDDWWEGEYGASTETNTLTDYDEEVDATSFGLLDTWQAVSRYVEEGSFVVRYEDENKASRFKITRGRAVEL